MRLVVTMTRSQGLPGGEMARPLLEQLHGNALPGVSARIFKKLAGQQLTLGARDKCDLQKPWQHHRHIAAVPHRP
jgi:hypothetical protein